jgi:DNA-binding SARP family transcriptional activator
MYMLCQNGQRNAAIAQCKDTLDHLEADLGITPEPETIALCKDIQDGKPLKHEEFISY